MSTLDKDQQAMTELSDDQLEGAAGGYDYTAMSFQIGQKVRFYDTFCESCGKKMNSGIIYDTMRTSEGYVLYTIRYSCGYISKRLRPGDELF